MLQVLLRLWMVLNVPRLEKRNRSKRYALERKLRWKNSEKESCVEASL